MKKNFTTIAIGLGLVVSASQTIASDQQIFDINDLQSSSNKTYACSGLECLLRMGTFSSEKYANRYKQSLANKTNQSVKVEQDKKNKNLFHVIVGPFNDFAKMVQTGSVLTGKTIKNTGKPVINVNSTTMRTSSNNSVQQSSNKLSAVNIAAKDFAKPITAVANLFKFSHGKKELSHHRNVIKQRTVAVSTTKSKSASTYSHNILTKHQQILASQADYPVNQKPKTDAKGNVIPIFKTGPYVGASAGVQINVGRAPVTSAYEAFSGTLSAGAGRMFTQRIYMAGEFYINDNVNAKSFNPGVNGFSVNSGFNYGGDFLPGFMITDHVLGYLRIGGMRALFTTAPSEPLASYKDQTFARRLSIIKNGWQIGAGAQTNLYNNLDVRAEYVFTLFHGVHTVNDKVNINQINLGLVYKFPESLRKA